MFRGQICNLGKTAINFRDSKEATPMQLNHLSSILVLPPANSAYLWFFKLPSGEFHHLKSSEIYTDFTLFPQLAPKTCNPHDKKIHINEVTPVYQLTNLHKFNIPLGITALVSIPPFYSIKQGFCGIYIWEIYRIKNSYHSDTAGSKTNIWIFIL